jgi:hypothetical protein
MASEYTLALADTKELNICPDNGLNIYLIS